MGEHLITLSAAPGYRTDREAELGKCRAPNQWLRFRFQRMKHRRHVPQGADTIKNVSLCFYVSIRFTHTWLILNLSSGFFT
ncbi:hypothetical protein JCM15831A_13960 [Asaia astilbis]